MLLGIDIGHGLKTSGKETPTKIKEWSLNNDIADIVYENLSNYNCEIVFLSDKTGEIDTSLKDRVDKANKLNVDLLLSIHHNAFKGTWGDHTGYELYTNHLSQEMGVKLALQLSKMAQVNYTTIKAHGNPVKQANLYITRQSEVPAILVECGYMDSRNDYKYITSQQGKAEIGKAITNFIVEWFELEEKITKIDRYKNTIQSKCKFSNPSDVWVLLDQHKYAESVYKKIADAMEGK